MLRVRDTFLGGDSHHILSVTGTVEATDYHLGVRSSLFALS